MAQLAPEPYKMDPARRADYERRGLRGYDIEGAELEFLRQCTAQLPEGTIAGALLSFPVADNYAHYVVVSEDPLTIAHVGFFDAYAIPKPHIRGLEREDVLQHIERAKHWARLMSEAHIRPGDTTGRWSSR